MDIDWQAHTESMKHIMEKMKPLHINHCAYES